MRPDALSFAALRTFGAGLVERLSPRQRQYALLALLMAAGVGLLWLVFALTAAPATPAARPAAGSASTVTNLGVLAPGAQVNPVDQWVGTAGRKLAQYESEREEQGRQNKERQAFEAKTLQRFAEIEQRLTSTQQALAAPPAPAVPALPPGPPPAPVKATPALPSALPPGEPGQPLPAPVTAVPAIQRVAVAARPAPGTPAAAGNAPAPSTAAFLPVSFTRGILLGGLDAPTGGQAQANPHPVLIRLSDNSVLPNRYRAEYRDCFVIAAGYGDISAERAYLRTESLSCVGADGTALEVKIQGSVYGEDGKVGMRGRLVTKQGQMLANALLTGVVSGIGQGLATSSVEYSTSPLGTVASAQGAEAYRAGLGSGVGKALDRLAQYYIKLAEATFPVIEIDAGREIDVVITKGVRIDAPMAAPLEKRRGAFPATDPLEATDDADY